MTMILKLKIPSDQKTTRTAFVPNSSILFSLMINSQQFNFNFAKIRIHKEKKKEKNGIKALAFIST